MSEKNRYGEKAEQKRINEKDIILTKKKKAIIIIIIIIIIICVSTFSFLQSFLRSLPKS